MLLAGRGQEGRNAGWTQASEVSRISGALESPELESDRHQSPRSRCPPHPPCSPAPPAPPGQSQQMRQEQRWVRGEEGKEQPGREEGGPRGPTL